MNKNDIKYFLWPLAYKNHIEDVIEKKNRKDTYNMQTEAEQEAYRHILTSALFARKYGPLLTEGLGNAKESFDMLSGKGWENSKIDLDNNRLGREFFKNNKNLPEEAFYDKVFQDFILPKRNSLK